MKVEVKKGNVQKAIAQLNKKLKEDGILRDVVERSYYTPPSEAKRLKRKRAISRKKKEFTKLREDALYSQ